MARNDDAGPRPAPGRPSLGIVADDLTGAGDCAVKFAEGGWVAEVVLAPDAAPALAPGLAVALVTDARAMSEPDASARTRAAVDALARGGAERLYLKIDSTLRGTVAAQLDGALAALAERVPDAFALICPAYPAMGRTVEGGRLLVHGAAPEGHRGRSPAITGALSVTLGGDDPAAEAVRLRALADDSCLLLADAATDADLDRVATVAEELGRQVLLVGSAGLASALARRHVSAAQDPSVAPPADRHAAEPAPADPDTPDAPTEHSAGSSRILVAVSSRHPVTTAQLAALGPDVALITAAADDVIVDGLRSERAAAAQVAEAVERAVAAGDVGALVLVGGDGALAVLDRLGAHGLRVASAVVEGVPAGTVRGGALHGLTVVTKSGGFGGPETLTDVVARLAASRIPHEEEDEQ